MGSLSLQQRRAGCHPHHHDLFASRRRGPPRQHRRRLRPAAAGPGVPDVIAALAPLATLVPEFPRLQKPVRDWLARETPQLPGFNGDDVNRILIPDLVGVDFYTFAAAVAALVWLAYFEGSVLREGEGPAEAELRGAMTPEQRRAYERRRGLSWLALVTALTIWSTGLINKTAPLLP